MVWLYRSPILLTIPWTAILESVSNIDYREILTKQNNRFKTKKFWLSDKISQQIFFCVDEEIQMVSIWPILLVDTKIGTKSPKRISWSKYRYLKSADKIARKNQISTSTIVSADTIGRWIYIGRSLNRTFCPPFLYLRRPHPQNWVYLKKPIPLLKSLHITNRGNIEIPLVPLS
jgi:hypothetical protein